MEVIAMARRPDKRRATKARTAGAAHAAPNELLLVDEMTARVRMSRWTVRRLEAAGRFPRSVKIGFKRIAWRASEIEAWIAGVWTPPASAGKAA
jgi:prophage regulatory protein